MNIESGLERANARELREVLAALLSSYVTPAFGVLPKSEIDLLFFRALRSLDLVDTENISIYTLMRDLRVSRSKARNILYDIQLRDADESGNDLDEQLRRVLVESIYAKDSGYFCIEIESPLLRDHLHDKVRRARHIADSSFNPSIVRMNHAALAAMFEDLLTPEQGARARKALIDAGAKDDSLKAVLVQALGGLASKVVGKAGDTVADKVSEHVGALFDGTVGTIKKLWKGFFSED
ncbi:MAG: hypothetical protein AAF628_26775 [Planctomycetota bacterium]